MAALAWTMGGFWLTDRAALWALGVVLFAALLLMWPRCARCDLPAFLKRRQAEPDLVPHYIDPRLAPGAECARCGADLRRV